MSFPDAVRSCLSRYATFSGRARRSEYWWFALAVWLVQVAAFALDAVAGTAGLLFAVVSLGIIVPSVAVGVRRLHDTGRSGWWLLVGLVPFGGIVLLVFTVQDGEPGDNAHGPSPKAVATYVG